MYHQQRPSLHHAGDRGEAAGAGRELCALGGLAVAGGEFVGEVEDAEVPAQKWTNGARYAGAGSCQGRSNLRRRCSLPGPHVVRVVPIWKVDRKLENEIRWREQSN